MKRLLDRSLGVGFVLLLAANVGGDQGSSLLAGTRLSNRR
jgi:hypothetical protein